MANPVASYRVVGLLTLPYIFSVEDGKEGVGLMNLLGYEDCYAFSHELCRNSSLSSSWSATMDRTIPLLTRLEMKSTMGYPHTCRTPVQSCQSKVSRGTSPSCTIEMMTGARGSGSRCIVLS